jgi:hypothetical protein
LEHWSSFVDGAVTFGLWAVFGGAAVFVWLFWRPRDRPSANSWSLALWGFWPFIPSIVAGWFVAGLCELEWMKVYGQVDETAASTFFYIALCITLWTALVGWIARFVLRRGNRLVATKLSNRRKVGQAANQNGLGATQRSNRQVAPGSYGDSGNQTNHK